MVLQGVERVLDVLEALGDLGSATLGEVAKASGISKSAAHRLLRSLVERGYAAQDEASGRYRLGSGVLRLVAAGLDTVDLRSVARPALEALAASTGETVHLVVPEADGVVYVDKVESSQTVRMASRVGMRGELHSSACGKAILAHLPAGEVEAVARRGGLPARTRRTITDLAALRAELQRVRADGYAIDDEENELDVRCIGMAVLDAAGHPVGAVSVSAPAFRLSREQVPLIVPRLRDAVDAITAALGATHRHEAP